MTHSRRDFIRIVPAFGAFTIPVSAFGQGQGSAEPAWPAPPPGKGVPVDDSFPSQHPALVKEMVGVSHFNIARVRELVQAHPELAKAAWDWGYGDWETALGAASHVGNRPIAELLLENGAPPTIFSAVMLGQLDIVKTFVAASPGLQRLRGPHGLTMMVHARMGGVPAAAVVKYLESRSAIVCATASSCASTRTSCGSIGPARRNGRCFTRETWRSTPRARPA